MKRLYLFAFGLALAALLVAQPAQAVVWNSRSPHPITPGTSWDKPPEENELWDLLDPYVRTVVPPGGSVVTQGWVLGHQTRQATFLIALPGFGGEQMATLLLEIAGHKAGNVFGIYDPTISGSPTMIPIFAGGEKPVTTKKVTFVPKGGRYEVFVGEDGSASGWFETTELGFYLKYDDDVQNLHYLFYTEDSRNEGKPQSLILVGDSSGNTYIELDQTAGQGPNEPTYEFRDVIVAFEDLPWDGEGNQCDEDYQDMVVFIDFQEEGSGAIPEPTSLAIWGVVGLGAAGLASLRRRRKLARWSDQDRQAIVQLIQAGRQR